MGAFVGLWFGLGGLLVLWAHAEPTRESRDSALSVRGKVASWLAVADIPGLRPWSLLLCCAGCGALGGILALGVSRSSAIAVAFALLATYAPIAWLRSRVRRRREELVDAWPDVVDDLVSAVRAGLSLPDALAQLGSRGPAQLRPAFAAFVADYRARGRFVDSLDGLKDALADPVGDRVVEALRVAREVGGSDLGGLLRTLSDLLRDDLRTRGELRSRQAWTVNGARLAVAAPWIVLAMLCTRPQAVAAYDTAAGAVVLAGGGAVSFVAYRVMLRVGRLPVEPRVLA